MPRFKYSLRWLMIVILGVSVVAAYWNYRKESSEPDLTISAADVAWATGARIWKVDLRPFGQFYGVALVSLTEGDPKSKKRLLTSGGYELFDTNQWPVLTVSTTETDGIVTLKSLCGGGGIGTKLDNYFDGSSRACAPNPPLADGDLIYLASDSSMLSMGSKPFLEGSRVIAVEILRKPVN